MDEFQFLNNLRSKYSLDKLGDDCAVLPKDAETDLLFTADMLIEDIDFRLEWTGPVFLGHKALAVSLSDVAAMGGAPKWAMLSLGIPETLWKTDFVDLFYAGWFELANDCAVELIGGDISRSPDKLVIDSMVGGEIPKGQAIRRSGAKPGDNILVTGSLGGAAGGLRLLEKSLEIDCRGNDPGGILVRKQLNPIPQIRIGNALQALGIATSMIDISDGLSSDLGHICQESGVGARISMESLPIDRHLRSFFDEDTCSAMALHGGEDFELLFTVSPKCSVSVPGICIGEITDDVEKIDLVSNGKSAPLHRDGFRHF
jgi:thiamine-monophosphate kinase